MKKAPRNSKLRFLFLPFLKIIFALKTKLERKQGEFYKKNLQASFDRCSALLQDIFGPLEEEVKKGVYYKQGGYCLLNQKIQILKKKYYEEPRKGLQVTKVICVFWKLLISFRLQSDPKHHYETVLLFTSQAYAS